MGAVTAGVIGAVGAIGGGLLANKGAKDAAKAGGDAAALGIAEQRAARDQFQQNISPYLGAGSNALAQIGRLNAGDFSSFHESPDYAYARDQSLRALDRSAAARGGVFGGGADADRISMASGLASQNYNNFYNRLANIAGMGQNAAVGAGNLGQQAASNIGNLYGQAGQAAAGGAINSANSWNNALADLTGAAGQIAGSFGGARQSGYQGTTMSPSLLSRQASTGQGSIYNFGNNVSSLWG